MSPGHDDDALAEHLFAAARVERPAHEVKQRALAAAKLEQVQPLDPRLERRSRTRRLGFSLLAALVVGGAVSGLFLVKLNPREAGDHASRGGAQWISAEPVREPIAASATGEQPIPKLDSSVPASVPTSPTPRSTVLAQPRELRVRPATLEEELAMLDQARTALLAQDSAAAFARLAEYDKRASSRHLGAEATLLRIQVLFAAGRREEASLLAQQFSRTNPTSPLVERARKYVQPSASDPKDVGEQP